MRNAIARSAISGATCLAMNAKSSLASSLALIRCGVVSRIAAREAICSGVASNLSGKAHSDLTGVDSASASPARSTMRPRCAGTSSSRECRALPCPCRNSLSNHCRYSERPSRTVNSNASAPNTSGERKRGSTSGAASRLRIVRPAECRAHGIHRRVRPSTVRQRDDVGARRRRQLHPQLFARDLLDPCRHAPRRLLELQLAVLGFQRAALRLLVLERDEQAPRLVARRDQRQRAGHENGQQDDVHAGHAAASA